jgi:CheY-like chemotaxis protein
MTLPIERSILIVEPDAARGKQVVRVLMQAGYDILVASQANEALRLLYEAHPDAVILSNRLPVAELDRLSDSIATMCDLPLIELADGVSLASVAGRLTRSTGIPELLETLHELLKP